MNKEQFKFLESAIGKDESRKNLMFLEFNVISRKCVIRSADAFIVKQIEIETDQPDGKYYMAGKQVVKLLKISSNTDIIELTIDGILCDGVLLKWSKEDFTYPDLDKLVSGDYGPCSKVLGFNSLYMTKALKNGPSEVFKLEFKRDDEPGYSLTTPAKITFCNCPEYTVILMPVRIEW